MLIEVLGVLEDGSLRAPEVPIATAHTVLVPQWADVTLRLAIVYPSGVPVRIAGLTSPVFTLTVQQSIDPCQKVPDFHTSGVPLALARDGNVVDFSITKNDFRQKTLGRYFWDVWLAATGLGRQQVVAPGAWVLTGALGRP